MDPDDEDIIVGNNDPFEEFEVNLNDLECLAKDLTKLKPYNEPLILFRLEQDSLIAMQVAQTGGRVDMNGMLMIPQNLYKKLED